MPAPRRPRQHRRGTKDACWLRDIGAGVQRVDHAAAGGSCGGNDHHGDRAGGAVLGNGAQQRLRIHPAPTIRIDQTQRGAADARLVRDFQPRNVAVA